ncbi:MAG: hypothetical protein WC856_13210 [Methylococcaceae bacterium]|jgi:hypothetical protein
MKEIRGLVLAVILVVTEFSLLFSVPVQAKQNLVFVGTVRNNTGHFYRFDGNSWRNAGEAKWDTCPQNTILLGHNFQQNGFWLCASPELANQGTWYFGNVVNNQGYYWEISGGKAMAVGDDVKWDTCWSGRMLGRLFNPNGFWICVP